MKPFLTSNKKQTSKKPQKFLGPETFGAGKVVFQTNFLRRRFIPRSIRLVLAWTVLAWLIIQGIIFGALAFQSGMSRFENFQLKKRIEKNLGTMTQEQLEPAMDTLHKSVMHRLMDLQALVHLQNERFMVSGKLAGVTRTLPARTWVREIEINRTNRTLMIHGAFLIDPKNPYEIPVSGWMEALKNDAQFGEGLTKIDMTESANSTRERAELLLFKILAQWEPEVKS